LIVPIFIDYSDLAAKFKSITKEQIDNLCDNVAKSLAASYYEVLVKKAERELNQTRDRYIKNISVENTGRFVGSVILDYSKDPLIKMIEEGAAPWDMKGSLLNSQKAKVGKNGGRYITIPFRIATPGAVADSSVFSGVMPKGVYDVVKDEAATIPTNGGSSSGGLTVNHLPAQYQTPATRAEIKDSSGKVLFNEYVHKTSIYAGLIKFKDNVTSQNTYGTFRRVSEHLITPEGKSVGSDEDSWINKGIERYNLVRCNLVPWLAFEIVELKSSGFE